MQVIDYNYYKDKSERNRMRPVILEAPRGVILDRYGREMVSNRLAFDCYVIPQEGSEHLENTIHRLAFVLTDSENALWDRYKRRKLGAFRPVLIASDIRKEAAIQIEEESGDLPGVFIKTRPVRQYNTREAAVHAIGYVGPVSSNEYKDLKRYGYRMVDLIGKTGVEKSYESYLKGTNGAVQYETDSRGRLLRVLSIQEPVEGKTLQLTLDMDLQFFITDLMKGYRGAMSVMEMESGGILALVSAPAYDPEAFSRRGRARGALRELFSDPRKPLINRVLTAQVPPGSTFKIVTAHAGLRSGKINPETKFFCPGYFMLGKHRFSCWSRGGHGAQGLVEAIEHSCNVYFYNVAHKLDVSELSREAKMFGLGQKTLIDLPSEKKGLVPNKEWKRKRFHQSWYGGETVIYGIGQGYLLTTPLQVMRMGSIVASNGLMIQPHVVKKIGDLEVEPKVAKKIFERDQLRFIQEGMRRAVQSRTGTGQRARSRNVEVSGKTGTAQASRGADHAWFVGYAPSDEPYATILVFLEHGGKGGVSAAHMAGQTLNWMKDNGYFR